MNAVPSPRIALRKLGFGLMTLLGWESKGFFIPYRYAQSVEVAAYPALAPLFEQAMPRFAEVVDAIEAHASDLKALAAGRRRTRFDQDWFPRLDAAAAYAIVRQVKPRHIVEIGSGHSTRFLAQAVADGGLSTQIHCIDPAPRASLAALKVRHCPALLKDTDPAIFSALQADDILFIDSSHIAMPGTDVDRLFLDVLPRLAAGVLIHIHDITLPDAYPTSWAWRGYNEQLLVAALLQGEAYEIVFSSHIVAHRSTLAHRRVLAELPLMPGALETSLWLRKRVEKV